MISPRVVTAPPGPSLPPRVSVTLLELHVARTVLAQQPFLEAALPERVPGTVEQERTDRLPDRVAEPARAQDDVARQRDLAQPWVRPRRTQVGLGADGDGVGEDQRVAVIDATVIERAAHVRVVAAADGAEPALDALEPVHRAVVEVVVRAAAPEELRLHAAPPDAVVTGVRGPGSAREARPVRAEQTERLPAVRVAGIQPEHHARSSIPGLGRFAPPRARRAVRSVVRVVAGPRSGRALGRITGGLIAAGDCARRPDECHGDGQHSHAEPAGAGTREIHAPTLTALSPRSIACSTRSIGAPDG